MILPKSRRVHETGRVPVYQNVGGVFYDYSGEGNHAVNGASIDPDSHDVTITDRGAYFDGVSSYVTLHNTPWGLLTLPTDWSGCAWVYTFDIGPFLTRYRMSDSALAFRIDYISDGNMSTDYYACDGGSCDYVHYNTAEGKLIFCMSYADSWYMLAFRISHLTTSGGGTVVLDLNGEREIIARTGVYTEQAGTYTTYLGTDLTDYYRGFVYLIQFRDGAIRRGIYYTSPNTVCDGWCYFNSVADSTNCGCLTCTNYPSVLCISSCTNPNLAGDCLTSTVDCSGLFTLDSVCLECGDAVWPSCDLGGNDLRADLCHSDCLSCNGPSNTDCVLCKVAYQSPDASTNLCVCPSDSASDGMTCTCSAGKTMIFNGSTYECQDCEFPCSECSGDVTNCTSCEPTLEFTSSSECQCPANANLEGNICICEDGYFDNCNGSCTSPECSLCYQDCVICSGPSSNECLSCMAGFFLSGNFTCMSCPSICETCTEFDACESCTENAQLSNQMCECKDTYKFLNDQCELSEFSAILTIPDSNIATIQFELSLASFLLPDQIELKIETNPKYTWDLVNTSLSEYSIRFTFDESIEEGLLLNITFTDEILSEDRSLLTTSILQGSLHQYLVPEDSVISTVAQAIALAGAGVVVASMFSGNLTSLWLFLNTFQVLSLIPLSNNALTPVLRNVLLGLGGISILPSMFEYFLNDHGHEPYRIAQDFGYETNDFSLNSGQELTLLVAILGSMVLVYPLKCIPWYRRPPCLKKLIKAFFYSILLRFWIEACLPMSIHSMLQLLDVNSMQIQTNSFQGKFNLALAGWFIVSLIQVLSAIFPVWVFVSAFKHYSIIKNPFIHTFHARWSSLYYEFNVGTHWLNTQYYALFTLRRLLYTLSLILLNDFPFIQASVNASLAIAVSATQQLTFVLWLKPFKLSIIQKQNAIVEICITFVFIGTFLCLFGQEFEWIEYPIFGAIGLATFIMFIPTLVHISRDIQSICQKKRVLVLGTRNTENQLPLQVIETRIKRSLAL